jgi:prophage tail gpP-like protein
MTSSPAAAQSGFQSGKAELKAGGAIYGGWKTLRITRSIEQVSGTFELGISDRWVGQPSASPIRPGEACQLLLDGEPVITGYADEAAPSYDDSTHEISVTGRDKTGDLVDCSAIYKGGQWHNVKFERIARDLVAPFGIKVHVEIDTGAAFASFNIQEGESVFECLERGARMKALLLMSNPLGDLVITRASRRLLPFALEQGVNIKGTRGNFAWKERFSSYTVKGQGKIGPDGEAVDDHIGGSATVKDATINRHRPLIVLAEEHGHHASLRDRAEWERNVRMGRGNRGTITVQGWRHAGGQIWQPNWLVRVRSPFLWLDADMLIVGCTYTLDERRGTETELSIALPEAFDLVAGIGASKLGRKLNDKEQAEKKKKGDDWSML